MRIKRGNYTDENQAIIHLSAEVAPFSKKGGLADVVGVLPNKIYMKSHMANIVISPYYKSIREKIVLIERFYTKFLNVEVYYDVYFVEKNDIQYYFIKLEDLYSMDETYMNDNRAYNEEVGLQYFIFGKCIADFVDKFELDNIKLITNDWHVSAIYPYIKDNNKIKKKIHIIHNYHYKGEFYYDILDYVDYEQADEINKQYKKFGYCNMSLFAMMNADKVVTVSNAYAKELIDKKAPHTGLDAIEAYKDKLLGLLNGVDYDIWNPLTDKYIYKNYDKESISNKLYNKKCLYKELNIDFDVEKPLIVYINRLTPQKGIDLFVNLKSGKEFNPISRMKDITGKDVFFIICGNPPGGEDSIINKCLTNIMNNTNKSFRYINKYTEEIAHKILAAADIFIMPSRYEPCGLTQMYALAYGVIPIVNNVGGLKETIKDISVSEKDGNGVVMSKLSYDELIRSIDRAISIYSKKEEWYELVERCMSRRFLWDRTVDKYIELLI